ncbi:MAG: M23 family metallopeptidase [Myxococcota bacterium]
MIAALAACACQTPARPSRVVCPDGLRLVQQKTESGYEISAANHCHVPMMVEVSMVEIENYRPLESLPVRRVVAVSSVEHMVNLERINPRSEARFQSKFGVAWWGATPPAPDSSYLYAFPFGGSEPRRLAQGVDGSFTHNGRSRYAFDFEMPKGTPIVAARAGIVLLVIDGFGDGGVARSDREEGNGVFVLHDDGTVAGYGHLSAGIAVRAGDALAEGDPIGSSGNSGYSKGPHLHFQVNTQAPGDGFDSIPIRFRGNVVPVVGERFGPYPGPSARAGE